MPLINLASVLLHKFEPERAHRLALLGLQSSYNLGLFRKAPPLPASEENLRIKVLGLDFQNPIGLAAGFDKDAEIIDPILSMGFGFTEVGSLTPLPQPGNPRPRLFRIPDHQAVINRMGFNNKGVEAARRLLAKRVEKLSKTSSHTQPGLLGINLGKNKTSEDAVSDYQIGTNKLSEFADYLVINVSSPNTPGLRTLQNPGELRTILEQVQKSRRINKNGVLPPVLVKLAPDLDDPDIDDLSNFINQEFRNGLVNGLIISNTTLARPATLQKRWHSEIGGLSGAPLFKPSTELLKRFYIQLDGKVPLIGVGGVQSGADAYAKIKAGASLIQLYTGFAYHGAQLIQEIQKDMLTLLKKEGYDCIMNAIGKNISFI